MSTCMASARTIVSQNCDPIETVRSAVAAKKRPSASAVEAPASMAKQMTAKATSENSTTDVKTPARGFALPKPVLFCIYMMALFGIGFAVRQLWHMMIYIVATAAPNLASAAVTAIMV